MAWRAPRRAARELRTRGVGTVVVAVDTTGAGDAFTAALAVFVAEGLSVRDAARRASLVAAITVTRPGTQTAFPTRAEIETRPGVGAQR